MGVVVLQLEIVGLRLVGDFKRIDLFVSGQEHGIFWSINEKSHRISDGFSKISGGAGGIRTLYLFNAIEALSQLSYSPVFRAGWAVRDGF